MSKKKAIKDLLEKELGQKIDPNGDYPILDGMSSVDRENLTMGDLFIKQLVRKAICGDNKASTEILDRIYGKSPQHITQNVNVTSYQNFLEDLALLPDAEFTVMEDEEEDEIKPEEPTELPSDDGASSDAKLLEDFGLL
jgi:hypothetical protein